MATGFSLAMKFPEYPQMEMEQVIFQRPDLDSCCDAWILCGSGDVTALLVPAAVDNNTLSELVAKTFESGDVYFQAENYWMNAAAAAATVEFLRHVVDGATLNR